MQNPISSEPLSLAANNAGVKVPAGSRYVTLLVPQLSSCTFTVEASTDGFTTVAELAESIVPAGRAWPVSTYQGKELATFVLPCPAGLGLSLRAFSSVAQTAKVTAIFWD